jgi:hypothetical protein
MDFLRWRSKLAVVNSEYEMRRCISRQDEPHYVGTIQLRAGEEYVQTHASWCDRELTGDLDRCIGRVRGWVPAKWMMHARPSVQDIYDTAVTRAESNGLVDVSVLPRNYVYSIGDLRDFVTRCERS